MKTLLFLCFSFTCSLPLGCSASASDGSGTPDGSSPADASPSGGDARSRDSGTPTGKDGASAEGGMADAPSTTDGPGPSEGGAADGGGAWGSTSPPSGFSRCGQGAVTPADFIAACSVMSFSLDIQMLEKACDAATITGGQWEVWCGSKPTDVPYVRVAYDGLLATGKYSGCMGFTQMSVAMGWIDANGGGSGMTAPGLAPMFDTMMSTNAALQSLGNTQVATSGTGNVFLVGSLPGACSGPVPQAVIGGATVSWK
jgi:hypothetical protein